MSRMKIVNMMPMASPTVAVSDNLRFVDWVAIHSVKADGGERGGVGEERANVDVVVDEVSVDVVSVDGGIA